MTKEKLEEELYNFLEKEWYKDNQEVLDDDMTDRFNQWITELDVEEIIDYTLQFISDNYHPNEECISKAEVEKILEEEEKLFENSEMLYEAEKNMAMRICRTVKNSLKHRLNSTN